MTFGPRPWSSTSAATEAPETVGLPNVTLSPPTTSTSPNWTISPGSPATFSTFNLSSAATRYCLPPVLMTANIFPSCSYSAAQATSKGSLGPASCSVGLFEVLATGERSDSGKNASERARRPVSRDAYGGVGRGCQGTGAAEHTLSDGRGGQLMSDTVTIPALGKHGAAT